MKVVDIVEIYEYELKRIEFLARSQWEPKQKLIGMYLMISNVLRALINSADDLDKYTIRPATRREKKQYAYTCTGVTNGFDVALNKLFNKEIEEGKEYSIRVKPWGILDFMNKKYPVYADDPGQCDYIKLDDAAISGGAYNFHPEMEFIRAIFYARGRSVYQTIQAMED